MATSATHEVRSDIPNVPIRAPLVWTVTSGGPSLLPFEKLVHSVLRRSFEI
jgi:hypothetical protein